ncbi:DUF169 domain-containing protein [Thermoproteus tenax]|uniref:3-hydroxy-3-methylglutaryl CoA synthase family enzyme n=1 Tax=Thermoproteus tenax (strain ATCC 35583 / DSM 2078 / JCM 9277 / NBRC 100435 / Kra 1) TaxID=768679 RepID=G4RNB2_THETK|nr:DUF169 domain-containing protein [Thermoproteus tenax]CCC81056.1 3-hydroxy-3-methylglutaryl CoA synthase family enzyme [Thermoproteus tenax Kra 1]
MDVESVKRLGARLREALGLTTFPVGVKFCRRGETCDLSGFKRPYKDLGLRMALCQVVNIARTYGWSLAVGLEDSFCMIGAQAAGLVDRHLDYIDAEVPKWHTSSREAADAIVRALGARSLEPGSVDLVLVAPLERSTFVPDVVVLYGAPAQISTAAKALVWHGVMPEMSFLGMASCTLIPHAHKTGRAQINLPGTGELILGRTESHEVGLVVPADKAELILTGMEAVRRIHPYPLAKFSLYEPRVPSWYQALTYDYYRQRT